MEIDYLETWFTADFKEEIILAEYLEKLKQKKYEIKLKNPLISHTELYKKMKNYTNKLLKNKKYDILLK